MNINRLPLKSGFSIILIALVSWACQQTPIAEFSASNYVVDPGQRITFTNASISGDSYQWDFGDNSSSTEINPVHSYSQSGFYTVNLIAYSKNQKKHNSFSAMITVNDTTDPCESVFCYHDGTCEDGKCQCKEGYEGEFCNKQITPKYLTVNRIEITRFPSKRSNGTDWDVDGNGRPDIYVQMTERLNGTELWKADDQIRTDAETKFTYDYTPSPTFRLNDPEAEYVLGIYDYDDQSADDYMGGLYFTPYHSTNDFPDVITVDGGTKVAFKLHVSYSF
ncbi:PKD domain-containing protein [bacterium SCSIO 12741]|nr:PKD domain-containing protein [bacterium SCSIO 12741]